MEESNQKEKKNNFMNFSLLFVIDIFFCWNTTLFRVLKNAQLMTYT